MMAVDERPEGSALRQLPKPVNSRAVAGKRLCQAEHREKETEDHDGADQRAQPARRVSQDQCGGEVNQQRSNLNQDQAGCVRIQR